MKIKCIFVEALSFVGFFLLLPINREASSSLSTHGCIFRFGCLFLSFDTTSYRKSNTPATQSLVRYFCFFVCWLSTLHCGFSCKSPLFVFVYHYLFVWPTLFPLYTDRPTGQLIIIIIIATAQHPELRLELQLGLFLFRLLDFYAFLCFWCFLSGPELL